MRFLLRRAGVCLAAILWVGAAVGQASWSNTGPPGFVGSLAVSPVDGAVYAGTVSPLEGAASTGRVSAIYRSSDHGATWSQVGSTFPMDSFPIAIAVDATNALYVALSRNGGVFKSVDAGRTLVPLVAGLPSACYDESLFAIAPSRPSTIYLSRCGLFRSVDSGATWKAIASPPAFVTALAVHPRDPDRILAGTDTVWFSDDAGESWTAAACEPGNVVLSMSFDPATPSRVLATVYGVYEVARSEDGGETWVRSREGFFGYGASAVLFDPGESSIVYATTHGIGGLPPELPYSGPFPTGVNRSTDGGSTWASLPGGPSAADLLAIDPTGDWVYAVRYSTPGVSVYQAHPDRSTIVRPSPRARPPQVIPRPPARTTQER